MINEKTKNSILELKTHCKDRLEQIKKQAATDLTIDEFEIDSAVLKTPKLLTKYNDIFTDETIVLKDLYSYKEKIKLERWKYYSSKQSDEYYAKEPLHHKILKSDVDKYLVADDKIALINEVVNIQKAIVDYVEKVIKEIQSRNFHCKVVVEWRKFQQGAF